jgi:hypothetical protein
MSPRVARMAKEDEPSTTRTMGFGCSQKIWEENYRRNDAESCFSNILKMLSLLLVVRSSRGLDALTVSREATGFEGQAPGNNITE